VELLLYSFGDGDDPAFGSFEGKFAHAVELVFQGHGDLRSALLDGGEDFRDAFDFDK